MGEGKSHGNGVRIDPKWGGIHPAAGKSRSPESDLRRSEVSNPEPNLWEKDVHNHNRLCIFTLVRFCKKL